MSQAEAPAPLPEVQPDRRLHPMSWLFELIAHLRQFLLPLLALFLFGGGDRNELWPLIAVGVLVLAALWRYFTFRYHAAGDHLVLRTGLLSRNVRVVPYGRIHNVAVDQSLLHRLFGVAAVRLESAGGTRPEAEMRVLRLDQALALEDLIRHRAAVPAAGTGGDTAHPDAPPAGEVLHHLPTGEVVRLGIVSNRGMVLVAAAFAAVGQLGDLLPTNRIEDAAERMVGQVDAGGFDTLQWAVAAGALLLLALAALRLLSVVLAVMQYHGFTLALHGRRLTVERGLLARWRSSAPRRRIQAWRMHEGVVHRLLRRRSLEVEIATGGGGQEQARGLRELAPVGTVAQCDALVARLLPRAGWDALQWNHFHRGTWWRLFWPSLPLVAVVASALCWRFGTPGLLALAWLPWAAFSARRHARRMAWAFNGDLVAFRNGWWSRNWYWAELDKLQSLRVSRNPMDRRCGTATLWLDTAGSRSLQPGLRIPFLPVRRAVALQELLARELAARPLRW